MAPYINLDITLLILLFSNYFSILGLATKDKSNIAQFNYTTVYGWVDEIFQIKIDPFPCNGNTSNWKTQINNKEYVPLKFSKVLVNSKFQTTTKSFTVPKASFAIDGIFLRFYVFDVFLECIRNFMIKIYKRSVPTFEVIGNQPQQLPGFVDFKCNFRNFYPRADDISVRFEDLGIVLPSKIDSTCHDLLHFCSLNISSKKEVVSSPRFDNQTLTCRATTKVNGKNQLIGEKSVVYRVEYKPWKPTISSSEKDKEDNGKIIIYKEESLTLYCMKHLQYPGNPDPNFYYWTMNDEVISDSTNSSRELVVQTNITESTIVVFTFSCRVASILGSSVSSQDFQVTINSGATRPIVATLGSAVIIGIIVGALTVLILLALVAAFVIRRKMAARAEHLDNMKEGYSSNGTKSTQSKESMPLQMRTDTIRSCQDSFPPQKPPRTYENERPDIYEKYFENQNNGVQIENPANRDNNENDIYSVPQRGGAASLSRKPVHSYAAKEIIYADLQINPTSDQTSVPRLQDADDKVIYCDMIPLKQTTLADKAS